MVHLLLVANCQAAVEAKALIAYISILPLSVPFSSVPYFLSSLVSFPSHTYAHAGGLTIVPVKSKTDYSVQNRPGTSWMYNVVAQHQMLLWSDKRALMFSFFFQVHLTFIFTGLCVLCLCMFLSSDSIHINKQSKKMVKHK